jgi:hypothetical protein
LYVSREIVPHGNNPWHSLGKRQRGGFGPEILAIMKQDFDLRWMESLITTTAMRVFVNLAVSITEIKINFDSFFQF